MYKSIVCFVSLLVMVAYGYPTVNDIADFDNIRRLEKEIPIHIQTNDIDPSQKLKTSEKNKEEDSVIKNGGTNFNENSKDHEDHIEPENLEPDWSAQGAFESDEEPERIRRWAGSSSDSFSSDDEIGDSHECDDHHHYHGHDRDDYHHYHGHDRDDHHHYHGHDTDDHYHDHGHHKDDTRKENKGSVTTRSTERTVQSTTISPEVSTSTTVPSIISTSTATGRINIDPRFGVNEAGVRNKRMVWNVAKSSNEFGDNSKPGKMRWMWDDQKPDIVPRRNDFADDTDVEKQKFFRPLVPVVNLREPCASKFERRDRHGRCRPAFFR